MYVYVCMCLCVYMKGVRAPQAGRQDNTPLPHLHRPAQTHNIKVTGGAHMSRLELCVALMRLE